MIRNMWCYNTIIWYAVAFSSQGQTLKLKKPPADIPMY